MTETRVIYDADRKGGRRCGECTLCCRLLPVRELGKGANERCKHQRHTGCSLYHKPGMPPECRIWSCRWLLEQDTADMPRPDRAHYVIDVMPDTVIVQNNETGTEQRIEVVQVWCDPRYPDAHRDPALRAFLMRRAQHGVAAIVRFSAREAVHVWAPPLCTDHQWHEIAGGKRRPDAGLWDRGG